MIPQPRLGIFNHVAFEAIVNDCHSMEQRPRRIPLKRREDVTQLCYILQLEPSRTVC